VTQTSGAQALDIAFVAARSQTVRAVEPVWKTLTGTEDKAGLEFFTGGRFPIDRVMFDRNGAVFLQGLVIESRKLPEDRWQHRAQQTFYRASVGDQVVESAPATFAVTTEPFWRTRAVAGELRADDGLRVGWLPDELLFVAQGSPPFTLVYGQAGLLPSTWPTDALTQHLGRGVDLAQLPLATLADALDTGGRARLVPAPTPMDWQTMSLWGVLVLGVGLVAFLAVSLVRRQRR
ncbi:MAG: DUF3999 domain-containing protein, partial [Gammaproteobacteria bacterium]|nr:DUF3999 domain-containing protein [Gammaproteobacteria bacterium]